MGRDPTLAERRAAQTDRPTAPRSAPRRFGLQIKLRDGHGRTADPLGQWTPYWRRYETAADRDKALATLNRRDTIFEYRIEPD